MIEPNELTIIMAERLKELRGGMSHDKVSKAIEERYGVKISRDSLMNYEFTKENHDKTGKNKGMRIEYLWCLADFYGVSADYILGLTDVKKPSADLRAAVSYTGLSEDSITTLREFAKGGGWRQYWDMVGEYTAYDSVFTVMNDFIEYALAGGLVPYFDYNSFRQSVDAHNEYMERQKKLIAKDPSSLEEELVQAVEASGKWYPQNMQLISTDEAADLYRTRLCNGFSDFLKEKYPLQKSERVIKNGND